MELCGCLQQVNIRRVCVCGLVASHTKVFRTLDLRSVGREFDSWLLHYRVQSWASC